MSSGFDVYFPKTNVVSSNVLIGHVNALFEELSIPVISQFLNWDFIVELYMFLIYSDY